MIDESLTSGGRSDQLYSTIIHACLVGLVVISTVVLAALHAVDQATVAAILGTSLGYTGGTSAARRITDGGRH